LRELEKTDPHPDLAVTFVTIGPQEKAEAFCKQHGATAPCIGDDGKRTYQAMGLGDFNLLKLFTDRDLGRRRAENSAAGFSQNWRATRLRDIAQLPGAVAIDNGGIVRWIHRGRHPGDLPPMTEMVEKSRAAMLLTQR
jgi:AhpC/TSA antioxidant enzyme